MSPVLASLIPVFLIIATGFATRAAGVLDRAAWDGFDRVTYYILFPALIGGTLAMTDLRSVPAIAVGAVLAASVLTMAGLLILLEPILRRWVGVDGPAFCSLFQGATRWNSFVAIALAANMYGGQGVALAAVAAIAMVPLLNVCATLVHAHYAAARPPLGALLKSIIGNPFIWSPILGVAWNLSGWTMPPVLATSIDIMGRAALAAGLLCVGAGLDLSRLHRPRAALQISLVLKLILMPLIALAWARFWQLEGAALAVTMLGASVPTASGSYLLARQLQGDAPLMAEILTVQTLAAMVTMPLMMQLGQ